MNKTLVFLISINYWLRRKGLAKDKMFWADRKLAIRGYYYDPDINKMLKV